MTLSSGKEFREPRKRKGVVPWCSENKKELYKPISNLSSRLTATTSKLDEANQKILETFRKADINIPLLDAMKQVLCYAKFQKKLCTSKRKVKRVSKGKCEEILSTIF